MWSEGHEEGKRRDDEAEDLGRRAGDVAMAANEVTRRARRERAGGRAEGRVQWERQEGAGRLGGQGTGEGGGANDYASGWVRRRGRAANGWRESPDWTTMRGLPSEEGARREREEEREWMCTARRPASNVRNGT